MTTPRRGRARSRTAAGLVAVAVLIAGALPAAVAAATAPKATNASATITTRGLHFPTLHTTNITFAPGENPPGRVTQTPGLAGYEVPTTGATTTVSTDVTIPSSLVCNTGSNSNFGDVDTSNPSAEVAIGFDSTFQVATNLLYDCQARDYVGISTIDPGCSASFGRGECPYEGFIGGGVAGGDDVELTASLGASGSTSTITDLTSGAHLSFSGAGATVTGSSTIIGADDFCFLPGGSSETCSVDDSSSSVPPPGYADYSPFSFTNATVDGTGLGAYLAGSSSAGWIEINDVWGTTLEGQTSYVGTGSSFTDTNAQLTLPTVSLSSPRINQPMSSNGTLSFDATLSFASSYPIYLDYATTNNGSAVAGTNYTPTSGTLTFSPGTTEQTIPVTVLAGSEENVDQNVLTVNLALTNPSYVAGGASADGTINEGPIIESVTPNQVPLNGGPDTPLTVTGYDLGNVTAVEFCPTSQAGSGNCIRGSVSSPTDGSFTATAPDATNYLPQGSPTLPTDTIATDSNGVSSPVDTSTDLETFGCTEQTIGDGDYQVKGCLTDESNGDDITELPSQVDGVGVTASPTDDVTYIPGSSNMQSAPSGSVDVTLPLTSGSAVTIFKGVLNKALSSQVTFAVPSGTKVAGIGISGTLTLTPGTPGQATGSVTATLPAVLGGGTGTLTFTTTTGGTLSNVEIKVSQANFMQLFSLTNMTLAFNAPGTWKVAATASTGAGTSTQFSGSLVYANNTPTSGSLTVSSIDLAGMVTISNLKVTYSGGNWSGSASIKQASQAATVAITLSGSKITSASVKTGALPLFGYIEVKSFDLEYNGTSWSLAVTSTLSGGGTASAALSVSNGVITSASLGLTKFALASTVTIASATVSYSQTAPNSACSTTTGTEIWCGSWDIQLPQATSLNGISGTLAFANDTFKSGSVDVTGSVPLFDGVFLTELGGSLSLGPPVVGGKATLSFGPQISNVSVLSVSGSLTRTFAFGNSTGKYDATGTVTALAGSSNPLTLGSVAVTVPDSGATSVTVTLGSGSKGLTVTVGGATASVTGELKGTFTGSTISLSGTTTITVPVFPPLSGNLLADNKGIAACAKVSAGKQVGFEFVFQTDTLHVLDSSGCSEKGF